MKKLVVFDLDGTLVNSIYDLADSVNFALRQNSIKENNTDEYYDFVGHGMENLVRRALKEKGSDDEVYKKVRACFDGYYAEHSYDKTVAYSGVAKLLDRLTESGVDIAVLSNKADIFMQGIINKCFPDATFSAVWGNREGIPRKPDPKALGMMLLELGYTADDCVYVGDSEVDVLTAKNAGVACVCVDWGFRSVDTLINSGAKIIVSSADELFDKLMSL